MNFRDYVFGQPITLRSPLRAGEVVDRINQSAKSRWWLFHVGEVVGGVRFGRLVLRYASSPFEYNAKPILVGRIEDCGASSMLHVNFRGPRPATAFFIFWYVLLFAIGVGFAAASPDLSVPPGDRWVPYLVLPLMLIFPIILHLIGTRNSDSELEELLMFLRETVQTN